MTAVRSAAVAQHFSDSREVEDVIRSLRSIMRGTGLARTVAIGQLVLDRFFDGSVQAWRDRSRNKNNSIRKLADRPDCPVSRSVLNQAIGVFVALRGLPVAATLQHIGSSHIAMVLTLPEHEREHWLVLANSQFWSVRKLNEEIQLAKRLSGDKRGRPPKPFAAKVLTRARAGIQALEQSVTDLEEVAINPECASVLPDLAQRLAVLEGRLTSLCGGGRCDTMVVPRALGPEPPPLVAGAAAGHVAPALGGGAE